MPTNHQLAKPHVWNSKSFWFLDSSPLGHAIALRPGRNGFFLRNIQGPPQYIVGYSQHMCEFTLQKTTTHFVLLYFLRLLFCKASFFIFNFWLEGEICQQGLLCRTECLSISFILFSNQSMASWVVLKFSNTINSNEKHDMLFDLTKEIEHGENP